MRRVILIIRDGWGYRKDPKDNAIASTPTPNTDKIMAEYPHTLLHASGEAVGLPPKYQGNSEVGHMTIGAGRVKMESLGRIHKSIAYGEFFKISEFLGAMDNCKQNNSTLHLIGLLQIEGIHSHMDHLFALLDLCSQQDFKNVLIHVITDGRDAPVTRSLVYLRKLKNKLKKLGFGKIATVSGRYYTMDRDKRWDRTKKAYDCIVNAQCEVVFNDAARTIKESHKQEVTDEFIIPRMIKGYAGIKPKDSIIFYNYRTDRTRQLTRAIVESEFEGFERKPLDVYYTAMTQFYEPMNAHVAFKNEPVNNLLGEVIAKQGLKQLRISETEKYAHVTFFFNGQKEEPNPGEERVLIASPKVATYDLKPEMSAYEVTDRLVQEINSKKYDFIVTNLVNGDMVGHTGITEAIQKAVATVDDCVGKVVNAGLTNDYVIFVFADHGNAEDQRPKWRTSHTINPVQFILVSNDEKLKKIKLHRSYGLKDIAPSVLKLLEVPKLEEMSGKCLF